MTSTSPNFWSLVDTEKYSGVCTAAMKVASLFGSTYLFIKNKHRTHLTDAHLKDSLTVAVSSYTPDYNTLVNSINASLPTKKETDTDVVSGNMAVPWRN